MGFCRRCGDIVTGPKCKCGGTAVAPVVKWNQNAAKPSTPDRWSQTYTKEKPSSRSRSATVDTPSSVASTQATSRFPRPSSTIGSRVNEHIASTTQSRPSSPLKHSSSLLDNPSSGILPSPYTSELSKVYGSVLQPKESLDSYHCHTCSAPFPPDATIYPDPRDGSGTRFMCRACFIVNGGSKGDCPACHRPVLILKSEGGFVENAGKVWHKRCFQCAGCGRNIGDSPMVDLLGQPSCADCFDSCLKRTHDSPSLDWNDGVTGYGGLRSNRRQSREGSPALEELVQRLGILKSRESTPVKDDAKPRTSIGFQNSSVIDDVFTSPRGRAALGLDDVSSPPSQRVQAIDDGTHIRRPYNRFMTPEADEGNPRSGSGSPRLSGSPKPTQEAIDEMKRRFLRQAGSPALERDSDFASSADSTPRATPKAKAMLSNINTESPTSQKASPISRIPVRTTNLSGGPPLRSRASFSSLKQDIESVISVPSTPELSSDFSDTTTQSSASSSPPSYSPPSRHDGYAIKSRPSLSDMRIAAHYTGETIKSTYSLSTAPSSVSFQKDDPQSASTGPVADTKCAKCSLPLFSVRGGGRYVTVPEPSSTGAAPRTYHTDCFRCRICDGVFEEKEKGQAVFVRGVRGACHLDCAPKEKITVRPLNTSTTYSLPLAPVSTTPTSTPAPPSYSSSASPYSSSRYTAPPPSAPATSTSFPRFGSSTSCPGCHQAVSLMERGVVPGPQGIRWHATCLICGGKEAKGRGGRRKDGKPGCGKKLDSSAKRDSEEGSVWCRECLLLLPVSTRAPHASPIRATPLHTSQPTHTGTSSNSTGTFGRIAPQYTGGISITRQHTGGGAIARQYTGGGNITRQYTDGSTIARQYTGGSTIARQYTGSTTIPRQHTGGTTIARQLTGLSGGHDSALLRQLTGGGLSPTRQLTTSPTKTIGRQFTGGSAAGGAVRPRPKSVIGMRDEGRGMFLVRQMTGGGL